MPPGTGEGMHVLYEYSRVCVLYVWRFSEVELFFPSEVTRFTTQNSHTLCVTNPERSLYSPRWKFDSWHYHANQNRSRISKEVTALTAGDDTLLHG